MKVKICKKYTDIKCKIYELRSLKNVEYMQTRAIMKGLHMQKGHCIQKIHPKTERVREKYMQKALMNGERYE